MIRLSGGTVGLRFTLLYGGVFLVSGAGLLALAFLLSGGASDTEPVSGQDPTAGPPDAARERVRELEEQLVAVDSEYSRRMLVGSAVALLVLAVLSLLVGRALARRVLRPLRLMTERTRSISADDLDRRLGVDGPADEVKDLADTIDGLLERLEASFAAQRRFVADASHELRTPLATMRASLDVAAAKPGAQRQALDLADRLRPQLDQVDELLESLLALARAQHRAIEGASEVDVAELASRALADRAADIEAKSLTVTEDLPRAALVRGDAALLERLVANVIDNAVVHNAEGGWVSVRADRAGELVRFEVHTGGRVLDQHEVDRLARPFRRLGGERTGSENGTGLGFSIVEAVTSAHGGSLELTARPEGGLRVLIALPAAAVPAVNA